MNNEITTKFKPGLYVVATPIGNLKDITYRAIDTLKSVDRIICEDTRVTQKLLGAYGIKKSLINYHEHSHSHVVDKIIKLIQDGMSIALVSDAGTPLISDPGFGLLNAVIENNLYVTTIPGACAFAAAMTISGLPTNKLWFEGFLPEKQSLRMKRLKQLTQLNEATMVFYESPNRLLNTLHDMEEIFGKHHKASIVRELTKLYETCWRSDLSEAITYYIANKIKGEIVIALAPYNSNIEYEEIEMRKLLSLLKNKLSAKDSAEIASKFFNYSKKLLYKMLLDEKS